MMQDPRRLRPSLAGPDVLGVPAAPPAPPPMQFAPMTPIAPPEGGGPNISPLTSALQAKMGESAAPSASPMQAAPAEGAGGARKKMGLEDILMMMMESGGGMA